VDFELNWFDLETRLRKVVFELLQPSVQRSHEDRDSINSTKKQIISQAKRLEELEFILMKSDSPTTAFDEVN